MGSAVRAHANASMRGDNPRVKVGIRDRVPDLIQTFPGDERGISADVRYFPRYGESCSDSDHIGFCDPDIEETVRVSISKEAGLYRDRSVGSKYDYSRVLRTEFEQGVGKSVPHRAHLDEH